MLFLYFSHSPSRFTRGGIGVFDNLSHSPAGLQDILPAWLLESRDYQGIIGAFSQFLGLQ